MSVRAVALSPAAFPRMTRKEPVIARIALAFVLCVIVTAIILNGPVELSDIGERITIALIWIVGVAWMLWTRRKNSNRA
jgi:hypothetical protein